MGFILNSFAASVQPLSQANTARIDALLDERSATAAFDSTQIAPVWPL
jgi:hypothetical protein